MATSDRSRQVVPPASSRPPALAVVIVVMLIPPGWVSWGDLCAGGWSWGGLAAALMLKRALAAAPGGADRPGDLPAGEAGRGGRVGQVVQDGGLACFDGPA